MSYAEVLICAFVSLIFCFRDPLLDDSPLRSEFVVKEEKEKEKKPKGEYTLKLKRGRVVTNLVRTCDPTPLLYKIWH